MASFKIGGLFGRPGLGSAWMVGVMSHARSSGINPSNFLFKQGGVARFISGAQYQASFDLATELPGYQKGWGRQGFVDHAGAESTTMAVGWYQPGKRFKKATARAALKMMKEAVAFAKANHQGWQNRTGNAERSIRIIEEPTEQDTYGEWGAGGASHNAIYFPFLEYKYRTLRHARDAVYNADVLTKYLRQEAEELGALVKHNQKFGMRRPKWLMYRNGRRLTVSEGSYSIGYVGGFDARG